MKKRGKKILGAFLVGLLCAVIFTFRTPIRETVQGFMKPSLPEAKPVTVFQQPPPPSVIPPAESSSPTPPESNPNPPPPPLSTDLPDSINLAIPFASQAPLGNWGEPYQEACEEAAIIMAHYYMKGLTLTPQKMDEEILKLVAWENKTFGYYKDTTAKEIAQILRDYFGYENAEVRPVETIDDIKKELAQGHPVVLPVAGRLLGNPNFRAPGPVYHVITARGYTAEKIITNDPGTRLGKEYLYSNEVIMNALHDWNAANILDGNKVMIIVR